MLVFLLIIFFFSYDDNVHYTAAEAFRVTLNLKL